MGISNYISYLQRSEEELAKAFKDVSKEHMREPDVHEMCRLFASWSLDHVQNLAAMLSRYGKEKENEPGQMVYSLLGRTTGSLGLLGDLRLLWVMTNEVKLGWIILQQCSKALQDEKLKLACVQFGSQTIRQTEWLTMKIKHSAPQILTVPL
jgi:hypothetical protein